MAAQSGRNRLQPDDIREAAARLGVEIPGGVDPIVGVDPVAVALARDVAGGSVPGRVRQHLESVSQRLAERQASEDEARSRIDLAESALIESARHRWS